MISYVVRACDCEFCVKHGAAYVSDPLGRVQVWVDSKTHADPYRQGSRTAEFILCRDCGVLVAVMFREGGKAYAAINAKAADHPEMFDTSKPVSPKTLSPQDKISRWQENWFSNVDVFVECDRPQRGQEPKVSKL